MNNDINTLRGDLQKLIAINACHGSMTVDAALALIGAFMLQISKCDIKDWKPMFSYVSFLNINLFKGKNKSKITELGFQECAIYIYRNLLGQYISNKKQSLISLGLKVITDVSEGGFLSFNNQTFNVYASQTMICGKHASSFHTNFEVGQHMDTEETNSQDLNTQEQEECILNKNDSLSVKKDPKTPKKKHDTADNEPFISLYNQLQSKDQNRRTKEAYAWQWLLSNDEYCTLKDCVQTNSIPIPSIMFETTSKLLSLYIGEFYKREYDGSNNPFTGLDYRPNYDKLCKALGIIPYSNINNAHLHTLYVGGGLPVHYLAQKLDNEKSTTLVDALSYLIDPEDEFDIYQGESLIERVGNTAVRESYDKKHSIFEYINACKTEKAWAEEDSTLDDFKCFIQSIGSAKKRATERKKFRLTFNLWTEYYTDGKDVTDCYLYPKINFWPEHNGERHYAISDNRLKNWGVGESRSCFNLRIKEDSGIIKEFFYTRCINGDFIPSVFERQHELEAKRIEDVTAVSLSGSKYKISIFDPVTKTEKEITNAIQPAFKEGYLRLYTNDNNEQQSFWTSEKGRYSFELAGIIFSKSRYVPYHKNGVKIYDLNEELGWAYFQSSAYFEDLSKHRCVTFYNTKGQIYALPKESCIHQLTTNCTAITMDSVHSDGSVRCVINGHEDTVYLVNPKDIEFSVYSCENDAELKDKHVEYRQFDNQDWAEYEKSETLAQGLYVFRLTSRGYSTQVNCYVIAKEATIELDRNNGLIKPSSIDKLESKDGLRANKNGNFSVHAFDNKKDFIFNIDGKIFFSTYNPCFEAYIELYGELLLEGSKTIIAYASHYHVTDINGGKKYTLDKYPDLYERLFNKLTNTAKSVNPADIAGRIGVQIRGYNIHAYTDKITKDLPLNDGRFYLLSLDDKAEVEKVSVETLDNLKQEVQTDSLLFQSLKHQPTPPDKFYAPLFISKHYRQLSHKDKLAARQQKIQGFQDGKTFTEDIAFKQFEIACEHHLYFAFSDILLSMAWRKARGDKPARFATDDRKFKDNVNQFLKGYIDFCDKKQSKPNVEGLKRFAVEFLFDWSIIRNQVNDENDNHLRDIYNRLVKQ